MKYARTHDIAVRRRRCCAFFVLRDSHESIDSQGERGFPAPVAAFLAKRYGHDSATSVPAIRERIASMLAILRDELGGRAYFVGDTPSALDVYAATFLTPLGDVDDKTCPQVSSFGMRGFAAAKEALADLVPAELWAHRTRMFEKRQSTRPDNVTSTASRAFRTRRRS